jgi:WD40 repeat protein
VRGKEVVISEAGTGKRVSVVRHLKPVRDVEFNPDGKLIATASGETARISTARSGRPDHELLGHFQDVEAISFSPDGRWLVTAGSTAAILWRVSTGERLAPEFFLLGHKRKYRGRLAHLTSASFSRDGRRIVTASLDHTVRVYDCQVCGGLNSLLELAQHRLARIRPK